MEPVEIYLNLADMHELMAFFDALGLESQTTCKNVYDYVIKSNYLYVELTDGQVFRFCLP